MSFVSKEEEAEEEEEEGEGGGRDEEEEDCSPEGVGDIGCPPRTAVVWLPCSIFHFAFRKAQSVEKKGPEGQRLVEG